MDKVVSFGYGNSGANEAKKIYLDSMSSKHGNQAQEKKIIEQPEPKEENTVFKINELKNIESKVKNNKKIPG